MGQQHHQSVSTRITHTEWETAIVISNFPLPWGGCHKYKTSLNYGIKYRFSSMSTIRLRPYHHHQTGKALSTSSLSASFNYPPEGSALVSSQSTLTGVYQAYPEESIDGARTKQREVKSTIGTEEEILRRRSQRPYWSSNHRKQTIIKGRKPPRKNKIDTTEESHSTTNRRITKIWLAREQRGAKA